MKKLMMFIIALIPVVLIFAIQLTSIYVEQTQYVAVAKVSFTENNKTIIKDSFDNVILNYPAKISPMTATNKGIIYSSSNSSIATVDSEGTITFYDFGEVIITASSKATNAIKDYCVFYVTDSKPHRVEILNKVSLLNINTTHLLQTQISPKEAENKEIIFSTSNPLVATISPTGLISAVGKGTATITATSAYSNTIKDSFDIEVFVPVQSISIDENNKTFTTAQNNNQFPQIKFYPENATNKNILYSVKNGAEIASINNNGKITFNAAGNATFVATSVDGGFSCEYSITYTNGYVISATLTPTSINAEYTDNLYYDLVVSKYPIDANDSCISFTSSNTNVAVIEGSKVKIVGGGKASITMTALTSNSSYVLANCDVNITRAASSVNISHNNADVTNGSIDTNSLSYKINYSVLPNDNTDYVTFSTTSNIASVNSSGVVTFTDPGTALINVCSIHSATSSVSTYSTVSVTYTPSGAIKQNISQDNQTIVVNNLDSFFFVFNNDLDMYNISYSNLGSLISFDSVTKKFTALNGGVTLIKATSSSGNILNIKVIATKQASDIKYIVSENVNKDGVYDANTNTINTAQTTMTISSTVVDEFATTSNGSKPVVSYESSDNTIATVNSNGNVTFLKAGTITLTLSVDNISKKFTIFSSFSLPTSFSFSPNSIIFENKSLSHQLTLSSFYPNDYSFKWSDVTFSGFNSNVVNITNQGYITAIERGLTDLIISIGKITQTISIEVKVKTTEVEFTYKNATLTSGKIIGNSLQLSNNIYPSNANNQNVTYSVIEGTGSPSISQTGLLIFDEAEGYALIRVETEDSAGAVYKEITVQKIAAPSNLSILYNEMSLSDYFASDNYDEHVIKLMPNETATFHLLASEDNLLDPENINANNIIVNYTQNDGLSLQVSRNTSDASYITLTRTDSVLKSISTQITFIYGEAVKTADVKFYKMSSLSIDYREEDKLVGAEQKLVFGHQSYYYGIASDGIANSTYDHTGYFIIPHSAQPAGILNNDKLYWFIKDSSLGYFVKDGYVNIYQPNGEVDVEITVGNEPSLNDCTLKHTFTFTFVKGVNVFDYNGYKFCMTHRLDVVMQTDLGTQEEGFTGNKQFGYYYNYDNLIGEADEDTILGETAGVQYINFSSGSNIYGNGHTINYNYLNNQSVVDLSFFRHVRNLTIKGANDNTDKSKFVMTFLAFAEQEPSRVSYCTIQNFKRVYASHNQNSADYSTQVFFKNCIIKHNYESGFLLGEEVYTNLFLENMIMYDTGNCAININCKNANVYIKGFFDVYNFKKYSEFSSGDIQTVIKKVYEGSSLPDYIDRSSGDAKNYTANIAIISIGLGSFIGTPTPKEDTIWFYNENYDGTSDTNSDGVVNEYDGYIANSDNTTGLNYRKEVSDTVSYLIVTKVKLNMWLSKHNASQDIYPGAVPNENKIYKVVS